MKVLGIDPGYERLGIAVLERDLNKKEILIYSDCFKTSGDLSFTQRLRLIINHIESVIEKFKPNVLAIESLFFNKNKKTVMRVSEVRGVIIGASLSKKLEIFEFTPLQVKIAVTGYGRSEKKQVIRMVSSLIKINKKVQSDDEFDAIAVALTFLASEKCLRNDK